jgi:hypothetical protein
MGWCARLGKHEGAEGAKITKREAGTLPRFTKLDPVAAPAVFA